MRRLCDLVHYLAIEGAQDEAARRRFEDELERVGREPVQLMPSFTSTPVRQQPAPGKTPPAWWQGTAEAAASAQAASSALDRFGTR